MMPGNTVVTCDHFDLQGMSFELDGLRHAKCEPFSIVARTVSGPLRDFHR